MGTKLQELTDKIYQEGIVAANEKADKIISDANQKAEEILKNAQQEAENIKKSAENNATEFRKNIDSEVKLATRQAISSIKQQISEMVTAQITEKPVSKAVEDKEFIQKVIHSIVDKWNPRGSEAIDLSVMLPEAEKTGIWDQFKLKINELLDSSLEIKLDNSVKTGFIIGPQDGSYRINFTEDDFESFFKSYLRQRVVNFLFEGE